MVEVGGLTAAHYARTLVQHGFLPVSQGCGFAVRAGYDLSFDECRPDFAFLWVVADVEFGADCPYAHSGSIYYKRYLFVLCDFEIGFPFKYNVAPVPVEVGTVAYTAG